MTDRRKKVPVDAPASYASTVLLFPEHYPACSIGETGKCNCGLEDVLAISSSGKIPATHRGLTDD